MRGIDVTQEQLDHAEAFMLAGPAKSGVPARSIITRGQLLTLLAWYGHIRAEGRPLGSGEFVVNQERAKPEAPPTSTGVSGSTPEVTTKAARLPKTDLDGSEPSRDATNKAAKKNTDGSGSTPELDKP